MSMHKLMLCLICAAAVALSGCSREQSDWEKARTANNADSYELFVKKYPSGSFTPQAQARLKELYEDRDWQKARDADTPDAYQAFLQQYPEGKWATEARNRVENFALAQAPAGAPAAPASAAAAPAEGAAPAPAAPKSKPAQTAPAAKPAAVGDNAAAFAQGGAAAGAYGVQLGAFTGGARAADKRWAALAKKYPGVLGKLTPKVRKGRSGKGSVYRLQVVGLGSADAAAICKKLKTKGDSCVVLKPPHRQHAKKSHQHG